MLMNKTVLSISYYLYPRLHELCKVYFITVPYGAKLWCDENLAKLTTDQKFTNFHHPNFTHLW